MATDPLPTEPSNEVTAQEPRELGKDELGRIYERTPNGLRVLDGESEIAQMKLAQSGETMVIVDVGVNNAYRRQGIANKLTTYAEQIATETEGVTKIGAIAQPDYLKLLKDRGYKDSGFFAAKNIIPPATRKPQ
jgi:ribosomal protein S18 acetylase RimI-like enzyme